MAEPKKSLLTSYFKLIATLVVLVVVWWGLYSRLELIANWITYSFFKMPVGNPLASATQFFIFEVPKVVMLLVIVVFGVGVIRTFFTPERTRRLLAGKREWFGNILASLLGIVTPFCSCSAIPLFLGFIESGVPLGVTFSFLIAAPMINEVAVVLLFGMFGAKVALVYISAGLLIAILSGWIIGKLKMERYVESWVFEIHSNQISVKDPQMDVFLRVRAGAEAVREIVGKVWIYVVVGIAVGAGIHGYVPTGTMASMMGKSAWWSVPAAVILGVPMYSNAAGIIPIVQALLEKGASLGTVLAFMMAVIGLSLPETIILRKVLKPTLIAVFISIVAFGVTIVGYLFNWLF